MMTYLRRNYCYTLLSLLAVCLSFTACVPEGIELPSRVKSIATDVATSVTSNGAKLCGVVSVYDTDTISCGIIYDTSSTLSSASGTLKPTSANGKYSVSIGGLKANTTYYYRAYALDAGVYKYGKVLSFTTSQNVTISTGGATDITTNGATLRGAVSGTDEAISCGFIYGTSSDMSSANNNRTEASSNGTYSVSISNLQANTTYYYCAYTIIDGEEKQGEVLSFTTFVDVTKTTYTVNGVSFTMIDVEGGTFTMGSSDSDAYSDEKPTHQVTLSNYSIGETEVTQALWQAVMGSNPSYFTGDLQRPVEQVSWNDCQSFISKLNELTGENFRLPTEAEWEYAARGGKESNGYKYSGSNTIDDVAWYEDNSSSTTHAVKTKQPNELGIYDMSGNVWEWCSDRYGYYSSSAQTNPTGPSSGSSRMLRGGSWYSYAGSCHVARRDDTYPGGRNRYCGLRLVRSDASLQVVTIETGEATDITASGATLNGTVSGIDGPISCGFIYATSSDMFSLNNNRAEASSDGTYSVSISNLQANTTYYYCAYVIIDGEEKHGEVLSFTTEQEVVEPEAIDLGLSVKWASFNVGANSPEDYGDYFAWGETTTKSDYSSSTSITYGLSISELESRGIIDAAGNLTAAYDAATANWGGNWRMPTLDEMKELVNECEWKQTYVNGVNGRLVTGPNGNSIFLPTAGYRLNELLSWTSYFGLYWSATPYSSSLSACNLDFRDDNYGWDDNTRCYGHVVRPVYSEESEVEDSEVSNKTYTVNGVSFTMIGVEGGTFTMGSPDSDSDADSNEKPAHQVTLSSYSIGETEVTQELWQAVMGSNPSYFTGDLQRPVDYVSWNDCQEFISKLNELTGENFRLPTEAEWEYAARGGNMSNGYKYSGSKTIDDVAWYDSNSSSTTHAVKTKQPNELGIYDMSGNVWEWCADWYGSYSSSAQTDPTGPSSGSFRVFRGGSRLSSAMGCRVVIRRSNSPGSRGYYNGLRLVR